MEIPIFTHLHLADAKGGLIRSRNHLIALTACVIIALPGGKGTASEVRLAMKYKRPVIAYLNHRSEIAGLPRAFSEVTSDVKKVKAFVRKNLR